MRITLTAHEGPGGNMSYRKSRLFFCHTIAAIITSLCLGGCSAEKQIFDRRSQGESQEEIDLAGSTSLPKNVIDAADVLHGMANYIVQDGVYDYFMTEDCALAVQIFGTCFANNPSSPYGIAWVPAAPKEIGVEYSDPFYGRGFGQGDFESPFRLAPGEAIVVVMGALPPNAKYFGNQTYLFDRAKASTSAPKNPLIAAAMNALESSYPADPNPDRIFLFASLGNSINSFRIAGSRPAASVNTYIHITATDQGVAAEIASALSSSSNAVFTELVPNNVKLGLGANADTLAFIGRYVPVNPSDPAVAAYQTNPPVAVLRVTPRSLPSPKPYGRPVYDERLGYSEWSMASAERALVAGVKAYFKQPLATSMTFGPATTNRGDFCIDNNLNCAGDTQDTAYTIGIPPVVLDSLQYFAIVGVNHNLTGNAAAYSGVQVYDVKTQAGVAGATNEKFSGTAAKYLSFVPITEPGLEYLTKNIDSFFVYLVGRQCGSNANCLQISNNQVATGAYAEFMERSYVAGGPATTYVGASYANVLPAMGVQIKLKP